MGLFGDQGFLNADQSVAPVDNGDGTFTYTAKDGTKQTVRKSTGLVSDAKASVQNFIQGAPPTNPANTDAGKAAKEQQDRAAAAANNFTPTATPAAGHDPAAMAELDKAKLVLANTLNPPPGAAPALPPPGMTREQHIAQLQQKVTAAQTKVDSSIDPRLLTTPTYAQPAPTVSAPTITPGNVGPAAQTTAVQYDPNNIPKVNDGTTTFGYNPYLIDPNSIKDAVAGSAGGASVSAKMIDPTGLSIDKNAVPDIDISGTVGRKAQLEALDLNRTAALGLAPSAAQILMQQGIDQAVGSAYGLAASTQGRNPGEALRQGVTSAADLTGKAAAQSAALRATEMAEARGQFGALASQIASGDISVAQSNQTKNLQVEITNLTSKIDILKANQRADLDAGIATASNQTAASIATLQAQTQVAIANMDKSIRVDIANQTAVNDASKTEKANELKAKSDDAQHQIDIITQNMRNAQQSNDKNAELQWSQQLEQWKGELKAAEDNQLALLRASEGNATNTRLNNEYNAGAANSSNQFNAGAIQSVDLHNQSADLSQQTINNIMQLGLSGQAFNAAALGLQTQAQYQQAKAAYDAGWAQYIQGTAKTVAGIPSSAPPALPPPSGITYGANGSPIIT